MNGKELTYRFMELSLLRKLEAIAECQLGREGDDQLKELDRWNEVFKRAKADDKLEQLWEVVSRLHEDETPEPQTLSMCNIEIRQILYDHLKQKYGDRLKAVHSFITGSGKDTKILGLPETPFRLEFSIE